MFGLFRDQNVGPGWVKNDKNGKKDCFYTSHFTHNPVVPKNKILKSYSLQHSNQTKK